MIYRSTFTGWIYFIGVFLAFISLIMLLMLIYAFTSSGIDILWGMLLSMIFLPFWLWLFSGQLRSKAVQVTIDSKEVEITTLLGYGKTTTYLFETLDGFETCQVPWSYRTIEFLYLVKDGKRVANISEYYHKNYDELKEALSGKLTDLGEAEFSYIREFREMFN